MNVGIKNAERERLTGKNVKMNFFDVDGNLYCYEVSIDKYLGEGTSSICYEVTVKKSNQGIGQKRVLKQFYPDPRLYEIDAKLEGMHLEIKGYSEKPEESQNMELTRLGKLFESTFKKQIELSNRRELEGVVVKPDVFYFDGATKYILYESDYGRSLEVENFCSTEDFIDKMYELAFDLQQLHQQGILYMDLRPENVLLSGNGKVKLFDFDASIDKESIQDIHIEDGSIRYAADIPGLIAPEIRPDKLCREFEQNKRFMLHERVDIYAFGAIMMSYFLHRYPTAEDCEKAFFRSELLELFNERLRGELTEKEEQLLSDIIWKCIQKDIGIHGRYNQTEKLVEDLRKLKQMIHMPDSKRQKVYKKVGGRLQAAYVMDRYPLSGYRRKTEEKEWILDSLIIGDDPIGRDFFSNIVACSQMLDTRIRIRLALPSADKIMEEYIEKWPLLIKTTEIYLNDEHIDKESFSKKNEKNHEQIVQIPFAEICFYEWKAGESPVNLYSGLEKREEISWIVMCGSQVEKNLEMAQELAGEICSNESKFIAYLDERGDGYDLRKPEKHYKNIVLFPFSDNDKYSLKEKEFEKGIRKQAKMLHKYYMKEWNERANAAEVWRDFSSEAYNINSSLCGVLSIPYKLESLHIKTTGSEAAAEYRENVLNKKNPRAEKNLNRMIYLEHRRWMCFMLTEGYDKPSREELEQYAFQGDNDQRNKRDKLHPCICDCGIENGIQLEFFSHDNWEKQNFIKIAEKKGLILDDLDIMSVEFHQLCNRKIHQMREDGIFEIAFSKLEKVMKKGNFLIKDEELLDALKTVLKKMLDNESNSDSLWRKICGIFMETISERKNDSKSQQKNVLNAFSELKSLMKIVSERNLYHDYKSSDRTILEILPLLLIYDQPIRRIYKPVGEKTWQNVVSSIIIEPEQLYLYTDEKGLINEEEIKNFLVNERGIKVDTIQIKSMEELENIKMSQNTVKSVLDITGLSPEETYYIAKLKNLKNIPVIIFQDGKIQSISGESEADYYKVLRRHITVSETFQLYHAKIHSEDEQNYMLGLASNYENIWAAYIQMNSFKYKVLVDTLNYIESRHYWKLDKGKYAEDVIAFKRGRVSGKLLRDTGIDRLLSDLAREGWIEKEYFFPEVNKIGTVLVKTTFSNVAKSLTKMFQKVEQEPYMHKFIYIKTEREPITGKPLPEENYYIYDDTLLVNEVLKDEIIISDKKDQKKEILKKALNCLKNQEGKLSEYMVIDSYQNEASALIEDVPGQPSYFRIRFVYYNRATKACFMKEGNILEAYVYYSVWKDTLVDDVKLNVGFTWDAEKSEEALEKGAITNEIDLVCSRNMQTFFISCKQAMPKTEHLQEIKYFADYFGVDGKAILITSNWGTSGKLNANAAKLLSERSRKMHIYYIDRQMIGDDIRNMKQGNLSKYLQNIFDRKVKWNSLNTGTIEELEDFN